MIKGALFDIDDTLYSHKMKAVPTLTLKALDELRKKGIKIGVCTSRRISEMSAIPSELLERIDCQIMDTGAVTLVQDKYFKAYSLDYKDVIRYVEYFKNHNISYHYSDINGDIYFFGDKTLITEKGSLSLAKGKVMYKEYEDEEITDLFFHTCTDEQLQEIKNINPNQYISLWGNAGAIGPNLVDKGFGLLKFCQVFSLTTDEVIAFGDGPNDDTMLEMAGIGVGIKGGKENTLNVADYVCKKTIEDGGIYEALIDLKILEEKKYDPKIFFFDIDCTTFDHNIDQVRDTTYDALQKLKDKGCKLCINTSRSYAEMYNVPKKLLDLMDCVVMLAGSYIIKDNQTYIRYLDDDQVKKCVKYLDDHDITYRYCTDDGNGYLSKHDKDKEDLFFRLYGMTPPIKKYENEKVIHFLFYAQQEEREELRKIMDKSEFSYLKLGGEFYPKNTEKGFSVEDVAKMYGCSIEQTCAFGDGDNDCTMLKKAGLGVAMGNATYMCKQNADYITDDISDEGLYNAMKHFGFIE